MVETPKTPRTLADLIRLAGECDAAGFVQACQDPFLVSSGVLGVGVPKPDPGEIVGEQTAVLDIRPGMSHAPGASNPLAGRVYAVRKRDPREEGVISVGRGEENDVVLADQSVSHTHAYFERQGKRVWVADIGSRNGTFLNQDALETGKKYGLDDEDVVTFGRVSFQIFRPLKLYMALLEFRGVVD